MRIHENLHCGILGWMHADEDIWGDEEAAALDSQIAQYSTQQLQTRIRMFDNNIR